MRLIRYFASRYGAESMVVVFCMLLAGTLEGIGLSAMLPVVGIALRDAPQGSASGASPESTLGAAVDRALAAIGLEPTLATLLPAIAIFFWLKAGVELLANRQVGYTVAKITTDLRLELLQAMMAARWRHYTRLRSGSAANALATEAQRASTAYEHMAQVCGHLLECVLYFGLAFAISIPVTLGSIGAGLVALALLNALVRLSQRAGAKQTRFLKSLLTQVTDSLPAVKLLKATGREALVEPLLERDTEKLNVALRRRVFTREALRAVQEPVLISFLFLMLYVLKVVGTPASEILLLAALFIKANSSANKLQR
ncbi:MAG TPA: ABC transporter transmembrane domain-containing protein, partial [Myxococcota bacterium]|nr:ABC transporter transmembrane domain-containing protein [Myxococcota bacterium]